MAQEKVINLLPLTYDETEALKIALGAMIAAKIDEFCLNDGIAKAIWADIILPQLKKINEKINKGVNNGRN